MRKKDADQKQAEAPRGKKKWIIIAVVAVVLIAAAVGGNTETQQRGYGNAGYLSGPGDSGSCH